MATKALQPDNLDTGLTTLLSYIEANQLDRAIEISALLLEQYSGSNAVQLIYGDLRNMMAHGGVSIASTENYSQRLLNTLNELKARLTHRSIEPSATDIPENILKVSPDTRHIIAVDLGKSRLYLLERQNDSERFQLIENHYISSGIGGSGKHREGDLLTPIGIYDIESFKPDSKLPTLYGAGAFTLNYPNSMDKLSGRTGSGIWLHGMPHGQLSRPPQDSEGCVVLQNELIKRLTTLIDLSNTPVLLSEALRWRQSESVDTNVLEQLQGTVSLQSQEHSQAKLVEVFALPDGSSNLETSIVYRVRFLLDDYSEPDSTAQISTQYWSIGVDEPWSLVGEE